MIKKCYLISYHELKNDERINSYEASKEHQEQEIKQVQPAEALPGA